MTGRFGGDLFSGWFGFLPYSLPGIETMGHELPFEDPPAPPAPSASYGPPVQCM